MSCYLCDNEFEEGKEPASFREFGDGRNIEVCAGCERVLKAFIILVSCTDESFSSHVSCMAWRAIRENAGLRTPPSKLAKRSGLLFALSEIDFKALCEKEGITFGDFVVEFGCRWMYIPDCKVVETGLVHTLRERDLGAWGYVDERG